MNRHQRRKQIKIEDWTPLEPASPIPRRPEDAAELRAHIKALWPNVSDAQISTIINTGELWRNHKYQVHVIPCGALNINGHNTPVVQLSIRRLDRQPTRDWRDFQRIKNQLMGPECEAIELYPAESRVVDTANQFHLWVVADTLFRFPFGWNEGRIVDGASVGGAVQRPLE